MRTIHIALAAAIITSGALCALGASTAPASNPTSAPAVNPAVIAAAKKSLGDFFHALFAGDQKAAFAMLTYSDLTDATPPAPKNQAAAEAMFNEMIAEQHLRQAIAATLGEGATKTLRLGQGKDDVDKFEKQLDAATVKLNDKADSASVQLGLGPTYIVILKNGKWLIDADKTQANIRPFPETGELQMLALLTTGYEQLAKDVTAKKFASIDEILKQVDKIDTAAKPQPATTTAPTTTSPTTRRP